ncbi:hypothetical protein [Rhodoblastus sp.]|jgi:hypothetical protein|uniref:hypothetical protein n=1 Tax=Rhodoblastus sp. TaxID=1962975 RepID=UPI0025F773CB|nr:hypothetical protein [Rhodoblastus sp.]
MSMMRLNPFLSVKSTLRLAACLLAACGLAAPALAQEPAPQPEMAFGQQMPRQFFFNKLTNPAPQPAPQGSGATAGGQGGSAAAQAAEEEGNGPFPKRYLLNRMFSSESFGEDPAPNRVSAPPPSAAAAPAAKTP